MGRVDPRDEQRHIADTEQLWNESYYLDWFAPDGSMGGYVRIGLVPNLNELWYWACFVEPGAPLVTVIDHTVAMPTSLSSLEVRHDGLWADHSIDEPLVQMTCSLESFALAYDDPTDVYRNAFGDRRPFGFDLSWVTDRNAYQWPTEITPRYEIPCRVHGEVLVGDRRIEVDGWGQRDHSWGAARDWWALGWNWTAGRLEDGTRWHTAADFADGVDLGIGYVLGADATEFTEFNDIAVTKHLGREGLIERGTLRVGGLDLRVEPLAWSPVLLTHPDGRESRFPRALTRFTAVDGRRGLGWSEWNQPPLH